MPENRSLKPPPSFWMAAIILSAALVLVSYVTGIAATKFGGIAADVSGMFGGLMLLFATGQSLPTRERLARLANLSALPEDKILAAIKKDLENEELQTTRDQLKREWHLTIVGAGLLVASFGISTAAAILAP